MANKANQILGADDANIIVKAEGAIDAKESNKLDQAIALDKAIDSNKVIVADEAHKAN